MHEITRTIAAINRILGAGRRGVLVTVVATTGSTYRKAGARAVISEEGETIGTLSGGCVERDMAERVGRWLADGRPRLLKYDSSRTEDIVFGLGLGCRGQIEVLVEPFDPAHPPRLVTEFSWNGRQPVAWETRLDGQVLLAETIYPERRLILFGGGADTAPVAHVARSVGWDVVVVAPKDVHPDEVGSAIDLGTFDAAVVMTHNFLHDAALLEELLPTAMRYIGLLGPRSRGEEILAHLGLAAADVGPRLHSPVGLDLGGETPEEIALAIVAEVQAVLNGRDARALCESTVPIHAPGVIVCR